MSKFISFILKQRSSKLSFSFLISSFIVALFDIFLIVFDCIQLAIISKNSALVSNVFLQVNILGLILNLANLIFFIVILVLKSRRIKSKS